MNTENIRIQVNDIYQKSYGKKADVKFATYWSNAIFNNEKTIEDLIKFTTNSSEYKTRVSTKFKSVWSDLVPDDIDINLINNFFETHVNILCTDNDIVRYIKSTKEFKNNVNRIIETVYKSIFEREPSVEEINIYSTKFYENNEYSISDLEKDISNEITSYKVSNFLTEKKINLSEETLCNLKNRYITIKSNDDVLIEFLLDCINVCEKEKETVSLKEVQKNVIVDFEFVNDFEKVFKRPIYIQEYVKYYSNVNQDNIEQVRVTQTNFYNEIKMIMKEYLDHDLMEHEFIKTFLFHIDDSDFITSYKNKIVYDDVYISKMKELLKANYNRIYDEILDDLDINYIFEKIQKSYIPLDSSKIDNFLAEFKDESDDIVSRIFKLYLDIFNRSPDRNECIEKASYYRTKYNNMSFDDIHDILEKEMMQSLEFHDIIKQKIREIKPELPVSSVYNYLSLIIPNISNITMKTLNDYITKTISYQP